MLPKLDESRAPRVYLPLTQLGQTPTEGPRRPRPWARGIGAKGTGQQRGDSPRAASLAGQARVGEGEAGRGTVLGARLARAPPACSQVAQSAGGSLPRLRPRLRGQRPTRRIGPWGWLSGALDVRRARGHGPTPARRSGLVSPPRLRSAARSAQPGEGPVRARTREGIPPSRSHPQPAPLPGIHKKKRTGAQGPGVRSPLPHSLARSCRAAPGERGWHRDKFPGPRRRPLGDFKQSTNLHNSAS